MKRRVCKIKSGTVAYPPSEASFAKQSGYSGALTMGLALTAERSDAAEGRAQTEKNLI